MRFCFTWNEKFLQEFTWVVMYSDSMFKTELGLVYEKYIRGRARRKERTDRKGLGKQVKE